MEEIRKDIKWWEWKYQISNLWRVKSLKRMCKWCYWTMREIKEKIIIPHLDTRLYASVWLTKNHIPKQHRLHRLIAEAFIPNPENKWDVNHKNWIRTDNRIENLEWMTRSENLQHKYDVLWYKWTMYGRFWKEHNRSKWYVLLKNR